ILLRGRDVRLELRAGFAGVVQRDRILEPDSDFRETLRQSPAVPCEDAGRGGTDLGQVFGQRQVWVGPDFGHRNTTVSAPQRQASAVRTGNGRPLCSNQYALWVNTRSAVAAAGIRSDTRPRPAAVASRPHSLPI